MSKKMLRKCFFKIKRIVKMKKLLQEYYLRILILNKYFAILKHAKYLMEQVEDIKTDKFENKCFYDKEYNYLI
jgi:hypothetical protein